MGQWKKWNAEVRLNLFKLCKRIPLFFENTKKEKKEGRERRREQMIRCEN